MTQVLDIHPDNPQRRLLRHAVDVLNAGGVIAYPTDSAYALGCAIGNKEALERIRQIRKLDKQHNFTLVCSDLSELATYAYVDNPTYRLVKGNTPGAYTFILKGTSEVPRRLLHPKRKTIGLRIPDNKVTLDLLDEYQGPIMSVTLQLPHEKEPLSHTDDIIEKLNGRIDLVLNGGPCGYEPTTVIDLTSEPYHIIRAGKGSVNIID